MSNTGDAPGGANDLDNLLNSACKAALSRVYDLIYGIDPAAALLPLIAVLGERGVNLYDLADALAEKVDSTSIIGAVRGRLAKYPSYPSATALSCIGRE